MLDPKKKFFLFKQSNHFCSVPWNQLKVNTDGSVSTCSLGEEIINDKFTTFNEIQQNYKLQDLRKDLFNDHPHQNCKKCVPLEKSEESFGHLRNHYNSMFLRKNIDYSDSTQFKLNAIDLHWSSVCDLKCITCWHGQSSSIAKEEKKPVLHTPKETADMIIDQLVENQFDLEEIYMSGGEPSLINYNLKLLQKLDKDINASIRINSNLMFSKDNQVIHELLKFKNLLFTISVDGMGDRFNYIRRGANWDRLLENITLLKETHAKFRINSVFFVGTADMMIDTHLFFRDKFGINDFTINQESMNHPEIWARNLPDHLKEKTIKTMEDYMEANNDDINLKGQLLNCLEEIKNPYEQSYVKFFENIDQRAGTNWREVFPEL